MAYPNSRQNIQEIHDAFSLVEGVKPRGDYLYAERQQLIPLFKAKILYTLIPKIACTSIKNLIFECERGTPYVEKKKFVSGIHGFYQTWREITTNYVYSDNWLKVLIVREPLQRLVSCYKNRVLFHKDLLKSADRLSKVGLPVNPSWEVFIDNFERYRSLSQSINHHSAPIVDFAGDNPNFYDLILNISELDKLLSVVSDRSHCHIEMPHKQIGGSEIDIGKISEKAKEKIHRFYAKDYDIYSKYFGSASQDFMKVKNRAFKQPAQGHPQSLLKHLDSQQESYHNYHDVLPKHLLFQSILIITYGRSGSTLLQGILNSIDGCLIRGENNNFCFHLFKSYNAIVTTKEHKNTNSTTNAWYGASLLDEKKFIHQTKNLIKEFLLADKISDKNITCYGFKEIRYLNEMDSFFEYLEFLKKIFPKVAYIFNTRNLDDVVKSAWFAKEEPEELKKRILKLESLFAEYCGRYENGFHITYEEVVSKSRKLEEMFMFLGVKYEPEKIDHVLSLPHSYAPTQEHVKGLFKNFPKSRS